MRRSVETLRTSVAHRGRRCRASARRQAGVRRNHGQVARHHACTAQLRVARRYRGHPASTEVPCIDRRHRSENVVVMNVPDIGEPRSPVQRPNSTVLMEVVDVISVDHTEAPAVSTPPWMEVITRSDRKPAEAAPSAKTNSEAKATAPSPERDVCGRPERVVACVDRAGPPSPGVAVREPAAVVIWRPSPRLGANPSPTIDGLIRPGTVAIRNPSIWFVRNPDVAVVGLILPITIRVQVLRSRVAAVGMAPRTGVADHVVAIAVPLIPGVAIRSRGNLVLRGISVPANRGHLAAADFSAALRRDGHDSRE